MPTMPPPIGWPCTACPNVLDIRYHQRLFHQKERVFKDDDGTKFTVLRRLVDGLFVCPRCNDWLTYDPDKLNVSHSTRLYVPYSR